MTNQHPITPPPELIEDWIEIAKPEPWKSPPNPNVLCTLAAQWGADQELKACEKWLEWNHSDLLSHELYAARRPKPPSLKEQAIALIDGCNDPNNDYLDDDALATIRRALEQLND